MIGKKKLERFWTGAQVKFAGKQGRVVQIVNAGTRAKGKVGGKATKATRDHRSYIVAVGGKTCWPQVVDLKHGNIRVPKKTKGKAKAKVAKKPSRKRAPKALPKVRGAKRIKPSAPPLEDYGADDYHEDEPVPSPAADAAADAADQAAEG